MRQERAGAAPIGTLVDGRARAAADPKLWSLRILTDLVLPSTNLNFAMADYDSDSSDTDDIVTDVLLGYASREPTLDNFSQLGGHPVRFTLKRIPSGTEYIADMAR